MNTASDSYEALCWDVVSNAHRFIPTRGDRVLDLGAHFGVFSLYCAARGCDVIAVEPNPAVMVELVHSAAVANDIGLGKIEIINAAVAEKTGERHLWISPKPSTIPTLLGRWEASGSIPVQCFSLAELLRGQTWDCVKVDIEGAEYEVFMAASPEDLQRIRYLTMEIHNDLIPIGQARELAGKLRTAFPCSSALYLKENGVNTDIIASLFCWR
jgi:FkbM family methyltransferase